jgi:pSer/pThr/pTyr-binding forkhead associated (FHA) protein
MASLIVLDGSQKDSYYPLGRRTNVIGRDEALMIQILDDRVSRKHLQISYDKDKNEYHALDMSSKHGVFINGNKIKDETRLVDGDNITIGGITLWFTVSDFPDKESALSHYKKVGERSRPTFIE